jgi:hypothetical protein
MLEFKNPIPVIVEGDKEGYAIYVTNGGTWENDVWCVVHCEGGIVRHYMSDQIKMYKNGTFGIKSKEDFEVVNRSKSNSLGDSK